MHDSGKNVSPAFGINRLGDERMDIGQRANVGAKLTGKMGSVMDRRSAGAACTSPSSTGSAEDNADSCNWSGFNTAFPLHLSADRRLTFRMSSAVELK